MAAGGDPQANQTSIQREEHLCMALWGGLSPKGPSRFRGDLGPVAQPYTPDRVAKIKTVVGRCIVVRAGKGNKDRYTGLPAAVKEPLRRHLQAVKRQHEEDLKRGLGRVVLPNALERKYPSTREIFDQYPILAQPHKYRVKSKYSSENPRQKHSFARSSVQGRRIPASPQVSITHS